MRRLTIVAVLALAACGGPAPYEPGHTLDAEDYNGPSQQVTGWSHEAAVTRLDTDRHCTSYRTSGTGKRRTRTCSGYSVSTRYVVVDDEDWYLLLADGTRVDVTAGQQAAHPAGTTYP